MSWTETPLETCLQTILIEELGKPKGTSLFSKYVVARDKVLYEIEQIRAVEPNLSDHGPRHIENVLNNAHDLIFVNDRPPKLSARDLYILSHVILFHDVGNLRGRKGHNLNVGEVFDWACGNHAELRREKSLIIKAAKAHTGTDPAGSSNTLNAVEISDHFDSKQVQLRCIAAILRLADELAEGPHRTTDYFRKAIGYEPSSAIFHQYASCAHVSADRPNERIRLTLEIQLNEFTGSPEKRKTDLKQFLEFVLHRINKLDEERRYTRYYCPLLGAFKQTDVSINFADGSEILPTEVKFQLDDLVIPGISAADLQKRFLGKCSTPEGIAEQIISSLESETTS